MATTRDLGWWYGFLSTGPLGAGLSGWQPAIHLAIALCVLQIIHVIWLP